MQDPRMAELRLLSKAESKTIQLRLASKHHDDDRFGLTDQAFNDLVVYLLYDGYINHLADVNPARERVHVDTLLSNELEQDLHRFYECQPVFTRINHKGRLRLFALRDELQRTRILDDLGIILSRRYWERDFEIPFAFDETPVSLLIADLDHFKKVNDVCGHPAGDETLKHFHEILKGFTEEFGDAYRLGGDEAIAIFKKTDLDRAKNIAELIRQRVESDFKSMKDLEKLGPDQRPTVTLGVATFEKHVAAELAYNRVDAVIKGKDRGRNAVHLA